MPLYHLDADWLISVAELFHEHHADAKTAVESWIIEGHQIGTSAIAWSEFLTGGKKVRPVDDAMRCQSILNAPLIEFGRVEAEKAAELFNQIGRPNAKLWRCDCFIAASAILANAELATFNLDDFKRFVPFGLRVVGFAILKPDKAASEMHTKRSAGA